MKRRSGRASPIATVFRYVLATVAGGVVVWYVMAWRAGSTDGSRPDPLRAAASEFAWGELPEPEFPIPPYARFLGGVRIVIDAGHGGHADRKNWKRGPTGLREAEVNLRVAHFLRDFLEDAGAEVVMTRAADVYLDPDDKTDLRMRPAIANEIGADLFLSLHHNGVDGAPRANYTTLFFHATPDESPASLCVARHLLTGLNDALRLEQHLGCALVSDYALFPKQGFAVLREAAVPAVLCESSFHSNPDEERRLRDPLYNRREAYGLFIGLARWAQAGLPRVWLAKPTSQPARGARELIVRLDDGLRDRGGFGGKLPRAIERSLVVELDGRQATYTADFSRGELRVRTTTGSGRRGKWLYVDFENMFGQHVLHPWIEVPPSR